MFNCNVHNNKMESSFCSACSLVKLKKIPFPSSSDEYPTPLHLIHTDLWGPSPTPNSNGYRYYIHFIDDYTIFTWLYILRNKSEAFQTFGNFKTKVEL